MIWRRMYCVLLCLVLCALYCFRSFAGEYMLTEEDFMAPEGYPQVAQDDVNGWLSSVPDEDMDFDQYQQIMEILYPELAEGDEDEDDMADDEDDDYMEDVAVASASNARVASPSNATRAKKAQTVANIMTVNSPVVYSSYTPYDSSISTTVVTYMSDVLPKLGDVHYVLFRHGQYAYRLVYAKDMVCDGTTFTAEDAQYIAYDSRYYTWTSGSEGSFRLQANNYIVYSDLEGYPMLQSEATYYWLIIFFAGVALLFVIYRSLFSPGRVRI